MMYINNHDVDAENARYVEECLAQRQRLNITVRENDILTVEEMAEHNADYAGWQLDLDFIRHGGA